MKRYLTAIVLGLTATAAIAADDQTDNKTGWNVGVAAAFGEYQFESDQLDDSSTGFKLFTGYRFNQWLGIEGAYHNFGDFEEDTTPAVAGGDAIADIDGFSVSGLFFLPFGGEDFEFYGKVGFYSFNQEVFIEDTAVGSNSPDGLLVGGVARFFISDQLAVRSEADWFDIDNGDLWSLNLGIEYLFGRPARVAAPLVMAAPVVAEVAAPAPLPAPPPAPVDSDGDDVVDGSDQCPGTPAGAKVNAQGCEEQLVLRGVNFSTGSATLTAQDTLILDSVADILAKRPAFDVEVRGHTDSVGSETSNLDLSQRRADSVRDYLVSKGISPEKLTAVGKGEAEPLASNDTADGRAENRRVTLEFTQR